MMGRFNKSGIRVITGVEDLALDLAVVGMELTFDQEVKDIPPSFRSNFSIWDGKLSNQKIKPQMWIGRISYL